jgi:hypothetical protein
MARTCFEFSTPVHATYKMLRASELLTIATRDC